MNHNLDVGAHAPSRGRSLRAICLLLPGLLTLGPALLAQAPSGPAVRVTIQDEKPAVAEAVVAVDPQPRIAYGLGPNTMTFGFTVEGKRITYSQNGTTHNTMVRIDGRDHYLGQPPGRWDPEQAPLGPGPFGKPRHGVRSTFVLDKLRVAQVLEVVPSKPDPRAGPGQQRRLDTCMVRYEIDNTDDQPHSVGVRNMLDMYIVTNDGALFASPTTHPGQILNGIELRDKNVPEYLQVLQVPNLQNPGFVAHFTFKLGNRLIGPDRVVMTNLGAGGGWDIPAIQAGDSAIAIYFSPKPVKAHGKLEFAYAYGQGIASNPENEGKVTLALGGSFEPNKLFTVTAYVDEPVESQTLTLELPEGMECVEGKQVQPVPPPTGEGSSIVLWKARVLKTGRYALKVRSSNGVTHTRSITITPAEGVGAGLQPGPVQFASPARKDD